LASLATSFCIKATGAGAAAAAAAGCAGAEGATAAEAAAACAGAAGAAACGAAGAAACSAAAAQAMNSEITVMVPSIIISLLLIVFLPSIKWSNSLASMIKQNTANIILNDLMGRHVL
jgi:hypothetical protein